jgi:hypothetical protein
MNALGFEKINFKKSTQLKVSDKDFFLFQKNFMKQTPRSNMQNSKENDCKLVLVLVVQNAASQQVIGHWTNHIVNGPKSNPTPNQGISKPLPGK